MNLKTDIGSCEECYKIKCRGCGWEPNVREVEEIQEEILTSCPRCGWTPKSS